MSDIAIAVENLGKSYRIGHHAAESERYTALRDVIARNAKNFVRKTRDLIKGKAIVEGDEVEEFWALKDVSFEVRHGEVLGIIGRNGAGKSTLLKILSRITEPTKGRFGVAGRIASLLEVGTGFHPELTGRENIFLNGTILGMTGAEVKSKFDEIVSFAEVERFLDTPVKRYSSGMYVRLAFAVAAHLSPEILIVDEVLAVGDARFQERCLGRIKEIGRSGKTVLFVSHNMSAVRTLCSKALILRQGRLDYSGSSMAAIDRYLDGHRGARGCDVALEQRTRVGHLGSQLRLLHLRLNHGQELHYGKPLEVEMHFECRSDLKGVALGIRFRNVYGEKILLMESDVPGERKIFSKGTTVVAYFVLSELYLEPGFYTIDVGARSGENHGLDYITQVETVLVAATDETPTVLVTCEGGSEAGVRPSTKWSFEILEARS